MSNLKSKLAASVRQVKYQNSTNTPESSASTPAASNPPAATSAERTPEHAPRSSAAKKKVSDVNRSASSALAVWPD